MAMSDRARAAHHLSECSSIVWYSAAASKLRGYVDDKYWSDAKNNLRWHLFQARFARLLATMTPQDAWNDADAFAYR